MTDTESFLAKETTQFRALYMWLKGAFSKDFFHDISEDELLLVAHSLIGFKLQGYFSTINFAHSSIVLSRDAVDSDYKIYKLYEDKHIRSMHTMVSEMPLPGEQHKVRITYLEFGENVPLAAKNLDYMKVELVKGRLRLSCDEVPPTIYVGRLLKALASQNVSLGSLAIELKDGFLFNAEVEESKVDLKALLLVRDFAFEDQFEHYFQSEVAVFLRSVSCFVQQLLYHVDPHMYALDNVQEAFCFWPELAKGLFGLFCMKCDPYNKNLEQYAPLRQKLLDLIDKQDTGKENSDLRRKTALRFGVQFVDSILKTNFFVIKKGAISYRLDSEFLGELNQRFPVKPFGVFYIYSRDFFGFHIRFQDLARGGMRTIMLRSLALCHEESPLTFFECYQLALTQEKKNKDIPEGGSKAICFLYPGENLYRAQKLFIASLLQLVSQNEENIVDYYGLPEYLYLGPDENMHDTMIEWIADYAKEVKYLPGIAFITSKPKIGINHKRYGVTSLGVNVCMQEVLSYLGVDPFKESFTVKMAGGPDGDVAGNQICNLEKYFPKTAKLITLIDVSGVIYDPEGLDLAYLKELFLQSKPIRNYPVEKLSSGGFLLDMRTEKKESVHIVKILCTKKIGESLQEEWLSGSEAQEILRTFVHRTPADVFIPAGGRPASLSKFTIGDFLDSDDQPTAKAIIEGANLYLTTEAREILEQKGTIIIKDSSANKGGVICSSYEVLSSLALTEEQFLHHKEAIVGEILQKIEQYAKDEVRLILETHTRTKEFCSRISERISKHINAYSAEIRDYLQPIDLFEGPYMSCFYEFCLPLLTTQFAEALRTSIPDVHKKAIIASWIASKVVYLRGLDWSPSIVDVLPFLIKDPHITSCIIRPH